MARSFRLLCDLIVFNYPGVLRPGDPSDVLRQTPSSQTVWRLRPQQGHHVLTRDPGPQEEQLGAVDSATAASRLATKAEGVRVRFQPHPGFSWFLPLWRQGPGVSRRELRRFLAKTSTARAQREFTARRRRAGALNTDIAAALERVTWQHIHHLADSTSGQRLLMHRIKGLRVSRWDRKHAKVGCPHCPQLGSTGGTMPHIMWDCDRAQTLWSSLFEHWQAFGCWSSSTSMPDAGFRDAVFSLLLPAVPAHVWGLPALAKLSPTDYRAIAEVYPTLNGAWKQHVLLTFQAIQQWRQGMHEAETAWTPRQALNRHASLVRSSLKQLLLAYSDRHPPDHPGAALLGDLYGRCFITSLPPDAHADAQQQTAAPARHLLFFDGGSRGNPGPGGAGAVIVARDETASSARVVWSASISMRNAHTTNNQAEYNGVICGLRAAHQAGWRRLEVIGDSQLILRQLQQHRPPLSAKLLPFYSTATKLADSLGVVRWHHHLRAFNKMADSMANVAMDSGTSIQVHHPTQRVEHRGLMDHLLGDFSHWQESAAR